MDYLLLMQLYAIVPWLQRRMFINICVTRVILWSIALISLMLDLSTAVVCDNADGYIKVVQKWRMNTCNMEINEQTLDTKIHSINGCELETRENSNSNVDNALAVVPYQAPILARFHDNNKVFDFGNIRIRIKQDWSGSGVAAVVWDAALVLAEYLHSHTYLVQGRTVIELGAGTGLAGIVAYKLGALKTVLTDREEALQILNDNVKINVEHCVPERMNAGCLGHSNCPQITNSVEEPCSEKIDVQALEWGTDIEKLHEHYDLILGADIIYIEETFDLLLKTLRDLTHHQQKRTIILLSCRIRYKRDEQFLDMLRHNFLVKQVHYDITRDIYIYKVIKNFPL